MKLAPPSAFSMSPLRDHTSFAQRLRGSSVLIVEDEYFLADDLARTFEGVGAIVVGPSATVRGSIEHVSRIGVVSAAVLDIRLGGELVFPVADVLAARLVPFVFYSGDDDLSLPVRFRHSRRLSKTADHDEIVVALLAERAITEASCEALLPEIEQSGIPALLPRARLMAKLLTGDQKIADAVLVEAFEQALAAPHVRPRRMPALTWLLRLVEEAWLRSMRQRLN